MMAVNVTEDAPANPALQRPDRTPNPPNANLSPSVSRHLLLYRSLAWAVAIAISAAVDYFRIARHLPKDKLETRKR